MRTLLGTLALAAALAGPASAGAQAPKIGYVDLQRALNEVEEGKAARALLKKDFEEKQKQLDLRRAGFEKLQQEFEKQAVVMSDQAKRDKGGELERKARELGALFQQLQADLSKREGEATRGIFDRMAGVVREIAEGDGFTMVFERNDAGLVYAPPSLDLTNELVRKYNARFGAGGAAKKSDAPPLKPATPAAKAPASPAPAGPAGQATPAAKPPASPAPAAPAAPAAGKK
jgi:outer membrane protein